MSDQSRTVPRTPQFLDDEAFRCLRAGDADGFHAAMRNHDEADLSNSDLRYTDMRAMDLDKVILRDAYLRDADLRGKTFVISTSRVVPFIALKSARPTFRIIFRPREFS